MNFPQNQYAESRCISCLRFAEETQRGQALAPENDGKNYAAAVVFVYFGVELQSRMPGEEWQLCLFSFWIASGIGAFQFVGSRRAFVRYSLWIAPGICACQSVGSR